MRGSVKILSPAVWCCLLFLLATICSVSPGYEMSSDTARAALYYTGAKEFTETANYDSAIYYAGKARDIYESVVSAADPDDIWDLLLQCHNIIGLNLIHKGEYDSALTHITYALEQGVKRFPEHNRTVAQSYNHLGTIYSMYRNNYDRALDMYKKSLSIRMQLLGDDHTDVGDSYYNISTVYSLQGDNERALNYSRRSLSIKLHAFGEDHKTVADSYQQMAGIYGRSGDMDRSVEYLTKALSIYEVVLDAYHPHIAMCYRNLAVSYNRKGDYDRALKASRESLSRYRQLYGEYHRSVANNYNTIGNVYWYKNDYGNALDYYKRTLSIRRRVFGEIHGDVARVYTNIGNVYQHTGELDRALEYYQSSLSIYSTLFNENHPLVANNYNNIGHVYVKKGDYISALKYHRKALSIRTDRFGELHPHVATSRTNIGRVYYHLGDYKRALEYCYKALDTGLQVYGEKHPEVSYTSRVIAETYLGMEEHENALQYAQRSIVSLVSGFNDTNAFSNPPLEGVSSESFLLNSFNLKAKIFEQNGDHEPALDTYLLAADLIDRLRTGYKTEESKLLLGEKAAEIYERAIHTSLLLYETTGEATFKHRAFYFAEKNKAAILQDGIAEAAAMQFSKLPAHLLEEERQLRIDMAYYDTRIQREYLNRTRDDAGKIGDYENRLFDLKTRYAALKNDFEKHYPDYYELKYQTETVTVQDVKDNLPRDTALLEYVTGNEHIYIFIIRDEEFDVVPVKIPDDFPDLVTDFTTSILKSETQRYLSSAQRLSRLLIEPVVNLIESKNRLIIIPHDVLYTVPFEALLKNYPATDEHQRRIDFRILDYLIKSFEISYHYSATLYINGVRNRSRLHAANNFIGFAPVFSTEDGSGYTLASSDLLDMVPDYEDLFRSVVIDGRRFDELRFSEWEVKSILELFAGKAGDTTSRGYFQADATEARFKEVAGDFRIVHIATHSFINETQPKLSGIVFAQSTRPETVEDGILYAGETYNLELQAELIVLSSCESGLGRLVRGEGMMALSRGFFYAGTRNIVFSLWKIPDKHTSGLMIEFYRQMLSGYSYAGSLRNAKLRLIENQATARPRSWASFVLIGPD